MLAHILDELNAWGALEDVKASRLRRTRCFGPKALHGSPDWAGVMVWCRAPGYYAYKTLYILGVWAIEESGAANASILVGVKTLAYSAPYFNAESYAIQMKRGFELYYPDDGRPPLDKPPTGQYDPAQRLRLRREVERELTAQADALALMLADGKYSPLDDG